jgi:hypothetical protein
MLGALLLGRVPAADAASGATHTHHGARDLACALLDGDVLLVELEVARAIVVLDGHRALIGLTDDHLPLLGRLEQDGEGLLLLHLIIL